MRPYVLASILALISCGSEAPVEVQGSTETEPAMDNPSGVSSAGGPSTRPAEPQTSDTDETATTGETEDEPTATETTGTQDTGGETETGDDTESPACMCSDEQASCEATVAPGEVCDDSASGLSCCLADVPYVCICPESPPCTWSLAVC